jgi:hypothetical protein
MARIHSDPDRWATAAQNDRERMSSLHRHEMITVSSHGLEPRAFGGEQPQHKAVGWSDSEFRSVSGPGESSMPTVTLYFCNFLPYTILCDINGPHGPVGLIVQPGQNAPLSFYEDGKTRSLVVLNYNTNEVVGVTTFIPKNVCLLIDENFPHLRDAKTCEVTEVKAY